MLKSSTNVKNRSVHSPCVQLGDMYPDIAQGAKNGLELTYDSILKGTKRYYSSTESHEQIPEHYR